jgi:large subunit ribosomal protein L3
MTAIVGRKLGMTQVFDEAGNVVPVTVVQAGPCVVTNVRTQKRDGYVAVQVGFEAIPERKVTKAMKGVFARAKTAPRRVVREFEPAAGETYTVGQEITVAAFAGGDAVNVVGTSRGRGFSGGMKRHGFKGQRATHGVSLMHRAIGSIGSSDMGRVWPGKRMPGRYGGARVTVQGLAVVKVDPSQHLLVIRGAVPGPRGSLVMVHKTASGKAVKPAKPAAAGAKTT